MHRLKKPLKSQETMNFSQNLNFIKNYSGNFPNKAYEESLKIARETAEIFDYDPTSLKEVDEFEEQVAKLVSDLQTASINKKTSIMAKVESPKKPMVQQKTNKTTPTKTVEVKVEKPKPTQTPKPQKQTKEATKKVEQNVSATVSPEMLKKLRELRKEYNFWLSKTTGVENKLRTVIRTTNKEQAKKDAVIVKKKGLGSIQKPTNVVEAEIASLTHDINLLKKIYRKDVNTLVKFNETAKKVLDPYNFKGLQKAIEKSQKLYEQQQGFKAELAGLKNQTAKPQPPKEDKKPFHKYFI